MLPALEKQFGSKVKIVLRHMPIDTTCNPHIPESRHPRACQAARVVEAARILGGSEVFWEAVNLLLRNQERIDQGNWERFAQVLGLDAAQFTRTMDSQQVSDRIAEDVGLAHRLGLTHTPAFYFNSKRVERAYDGAVWRELVAELD
jgi:protein-disulfide isomerase